VASDRFVPRPDGPRARARRRVTRAEDEAHFEWPPAPEDLALIEVVDATTFRVVQVNETSATKSGDLDLLRQLRPERVAPPSAPMIPPAMRLSVPPLLGSLMAAAGVAAIGFSAYLSLGTLQHGSRLEGSSAGLSGDAAFLPVAPAFTPMPLAQVRVPSRSVTAYVMPSSSRASRASRASVSRSSQAPRRDITRRVPPAPAARLASTSTSTSTAARATKTQPHALNWLRPSAAAVANAKAEPPKPTTTPAPALTPLAVEPSVPVHTTPVSTASAHESSLDRGKQEIYAALKQYELAYERLDADAVRAVWPSVDTRALARAFHDLKSQALVFDRCDVSVATMLASAACRGRATYETRAGQQATRTERLEWTFQLQKTNQAWRIVKASAR